MEMGGYVIVFLLFMEIFVFFFEVIFLSIYLYIWDCFKNKWIYFLISILVIIGGFFLVFFIILVNLFMNMFVGFELKNGKMVNV